MRITEGPFLDIAGLFECRNDADRDYFARAAQPTGQGYRSAQGCIARSVNAARRWVIVVITLFLCVGAGSVVRDFSQPRKSPSDARARAFARWFWFDMSHDGEVVCLFRDLGLSFSQEEKYELSWLYTYLCNQEIYSPRHRSATAAERPPDEDRHPHAHPP